MTRFWEHDIEFFFLFLDLNAVTLTILQDKFVQLERVGIITKYK